MDDSTSAERHRRARAFGAQGSPSGILMDDRFDQEINDVVDEVLRTVHQPAEPGTRKPSAATPAPKPAQPSPLPSRAASPALANHPDTGTLWRIVEVGVAVVVGVVALFAIFRPSPAPAELSGTTAVMATPSRAAPTDVPAAHERRSIPPESLVFTTDARGRVVGVSGPDPQAVLVGLCAHAQFARTLSPIALAPAVPPSAGDRLGLVRDSEDVSVARYIAIHLDARTGRWFAGDGKKPLEMQSAPTQVIPLQ